MQLKFDESGNVILPRINKGKSFIGPEWAGCCNTRCVRPLSAT